MTGPLNEAAGCGTAASLSGTGFLLNETATATVPLDSSGTSAPSLSPPAGVPDFKPEPRVVDKRVYRAFHAADPWCISCGTDKARIHAHHILGRAQGGDDVPENLVGLCFGCHQALHGTPCRSDTYRIDAEWVRNAIGRYIASERGRHSLAYLRSKRTDGWISARFGVEL